MKRIISLLVVEQARTQLFRRRGVHFKLQRTSCQQSLKYISIRKVHLFLLRKEKSFCVGKIRNTILSIALGNSKPGRSSS